MPELPEVETVVRTIAPRILGKAITGVWVSGSRVLGGQAAILSQRLPSRTIEQVRRHGKNILLDLDDGSLLIIHLGMTGKLFPFESHGPHTRFVLEMEDGAIEFNDIRQFGKVEWSERPPDRFQRLGPDALSVGQSEFRQMLTQRNARLKALLLDQSFLSGIGNIYADEALFASRIHPLTPSSRLSAIRANRLWASIQDVLAAAIQAGGSSISDYVDGEGRKGYFQHAHRVYRRTGQPCSRCGSPIRKILVGQRSTHYCPRCQRR